VNCYAEVQAARIVRMGKGKPTAYDGLARTTAAGEARWTGEVWLVPEQLAWPLRKRKPQRIFVNSMSDLFHEKLTNEQIAAVFGVMAACPQHTFQVLTKRARRMREWFEWAGRLNLDDLRGLAMGAMKWARDAVLVRRGTTWPLPNVWLGVSVEDQAAADERIPELLRTPAAVRFLSCEPLIGPVSVSAWLEVGPLSRHRSLLDWVIAGCESGPGARQCDVEWLRSLRDQCASAGVAFFLKQANASTFTVIGGADHQRGPRHEVARGEGSSRKPGGVIELPYLDGVQHAEFPASQKETPR
jgi:protein gp37